MRDPVPDIREIITDRKEAGGLPSSTFLNLAPEKQEKLLSAAVREFTERPYNEASINRIVREAGIPRGSFYMYFRDKEDLFHYLMEESINEMLMVFEEVLRSQGATSSQPCQPCMIIFGAVGQRTAVWGAWV